MLTDKQIYELVRSYINTSLQDMEDMKVHNIFVPRDIEELSDQIESTEYVIYEKREALAYNHLKSIHHITKRVLEENGLTVDEDSSSYKKLSRELIKADIKILETELKRLTGDYSDPEGSLIAGYGGGFQTPSVQGGIEAETETSSLDMSLTDLIELYVKEKMAKGDWSDKTHQEHMSIFSFFHELMGNPEIKTIRRPFMVECLDKMQRLPARRKQLAEYRDKTIDELLALPSNPNPIGVQTIKKRIVAISSLFKWAVDNEYMSRNPATGLAPKDSRSDDEHRQVYSPELIQKMVDVIAEKYRWKQADRPDRWWIPLIAIYNGLRLNEICQLYRDDITQSEGVWCFDVNDKKDKKVKNRNSKRLVPIHPVLLDLGFVDFCETVNHERLWPALKIGSQGYSTDFTRWFQKVNRRHITKEKGLVFHSFRHNFIDGLMQVGVPLNEVAQLAGQKDKTVTGGRYAKGMRVPAKLERVKLLRYEIDLSSLMNKPAIEL